MSAPKGDISLQLICCGYEDGWQVFDSYAAAEQFREDYCNATGHERQAILHREPEPLELGYWECSERQIGERGHRVRRHPGGEQ